MRRHRLGRPARQAGQSPQGAELATTTRVAGPQAAHPRPRPRATTPATSWPSGAGSGPSAGWAPARIILASVAQVSADAHVDHDLPGPGERVGHVLEPEVAGAVEDQRSHTATLHRSPTRGGSMPRPPVTEAATPYPEHLRDMVEEYLEDLTSRRPTRTSCAEMAGTQGLIDAMRHSLLAGGKRIRPVLALATCESLGAAARGAAARRRRASSWCTPTR